MQNHKDHCVRCVIKSIKNHQQYSGGQISNINLSPGQGTKPALEQWKNKENHNIQFKLARKLYHETIWHMTITRLIISQFLIYITSFVIAISVRFYCFTGPSVPNLEVKPVVPELTTSDSEHFWWCLFSHILHLRAFNFFWLNLKVYGNLSLWMMRIFYMNGMSYLFKFPFCLLGISQNYFPMGTKFNSNGA